MLSLTLRLVFALALIAGWASQADAFPQFKKQFEALYVEEGASEFGGLGKKEGCYICHKGKKGKHFPRNFYGETLDEYLGKKDRKDVEKIVASIKKIADESSDPSDADAPTFGELIAEGKLPGGLLEDLKAETEEASEESEGSDEG